MRRTLLNLPPTQWPLGIKILGSGVVPAVVVIAQHLIFREFPIHFAPSLLAVCILGWYFGPAIGAFATIASAAAVNFFLLNPIRNWSLTAPEIVATLSFVGLAAFGLLAIASIRNLLGRLEIALETANNAASLESARRRASENTVAQKLESLEAEIARLNGYAESYERAKRYAIVAKTRLTELRTAIEEFPLPIALIGDERGLPVIRVASKDFYALARSSENLATLDMFASILAPNLCSYPEERHPLVRALRGEKVVHEAATWCASEVPQPVHLYVKPIVENRFLAIAVIAGKRSPPALVH